MNYKGNIFVQPRDTALERSTDLYGGPLPKEAVARSGVHEVVESQPEMLIMPKVAHAGLPFRSPHELWIIQRGLTPAGGMNREQHGPTVASTSLELPSAS